MSNTSSDKIDQLKRTCRVKWFGKGYGFVIDVDDTSKEYFVHHTALIVSNKKDDDEHRIYKKLEKGEYIECSIIRDSNGRDCAVNVSGIRNGPLMCESNPVNNNQREPRRNYYRSNYGRSRSRSRGRRHHSYDDDSTSSSTSSRTPSSRRRRRTRSSTRSR